MLITKRKQRIIDECLVEIIKNIVIDRNVEALDELLSFVPEENLIGFLPGMGEEIDWSKESPWDKKRMEEEGNPLKNYI